MTLTLHAPAKLNLFLHLTGKRSDGYHLLESLVMFTEFGDTLSIDPSGPLTFAIEGPLAGALEDDAHHNLVMRAATELRFRSGTAEGAHLVLDKHIPLGAGLGGGSSDAAAAIEGLCRLWKVFGIDDTKHKLALSLGADVKMCLKPAPCFVRGIGEETLPVAVACPFWAVLVHPGEPLSTAEVYARFDGRFDAPAACPARFELFDTLVAFLASKRNALQDVAVQMLPVISDILNALDSTAGCRLARMSGSGSACFGLYADEAQARAAAENLHATFPSWWVAATAMRLG